MSAFKSRYAYHDFAKTVRRERRFIFEGTAADFLVAVRASSGSRSATVKTGKRFFRAQPGSEFVPRKDDPGVEDECPWPEKRMIPDPKLTKAGRATPRGFAYLYLATNPETALAEMRPWLGQSMTLATFEVQSDLKIVVCEPERNRPIEWFYRDDLSTEELDKAVWDDIGHAFSRPVNRDEEEIEYLSTQILAEAFKAEGFDGVAYRSSLERGLNVVLFNVRDVKLTRRFVYSLKKVRYDFEAVPNFGMSVTRDGKSDHIQEIHTESA